MLYLAWKAALVTMKHSRYAHTESSLFKSRKKLHWQHKSQKSGRLWWYDRKINTVYSGMRNCLKQECVWIEKVDSESFKTNTNIYFGNKNFHYNSLYQGAWHVMVSCRQKLAILPCIMQAECLSLWWISEPVKENLWVAATVPGVLWAGYR